MFERSNCDRKLQLAWIKTELLNPRGEREGKGGGRDRDYANVTACLEKD